MPRPPLADRIYETATGDVVDVIETRLGMLGIGDSAPDMDSRSLTDQQAADDDDACLPAHGVSFADDGAYFYIGPASQA